jgi:AcrR family transcriptional regulator
MTLDEQAALIRGEGCARRRRELLMQTQDRRVKRTQKLLAEALIELTLEKGYEAVTIRDITQRADVAYTTFFRHYHDKDALLHDVLDVVLEDLVALLQPHMPSDDPAEVGGLLFRYVRDHSEVTRVLLDTHGSRALIQRMVAKGSQRVLKEHQPRSDSPVPAEVAANHLVASSIALLQWWLEHDMPYSPERMGVIYRDLIYQPAVAVAFAD